MTDSTLVVTDVTMRGERATITFEDGHRVAFDGYSHGWGYQFEGLRHFRIFNGEQQVVQYDSRLRRMGPSDDEHRFVQLDEGYTPEIVARYWRASQQYLNEEYCEKGAANEKLHFPWILSGEGWVDLMRIEEGNARLPEPAHS